MSEEAHSEQFAREPADGGSADDPRDTDPTGDDPTDDDPTDDDPTDDDPTDPDSTELGPTDVDPMVHLRNDPALEPLVEAHGPVEPEPADDLFERTVVSILRQQISMDAAAAIRERLFDAVEVTPAAVLAADEAELRDCGLSAAKVEYLRSAAERFEERGYDREYFAELDDDAVTAELTEIRGFGPWTAKMVLLFGLGREDVFPVEDLGVRQAMAEFVEAELARTEMVERAEAWRPYRSHATLLLWNALEG